MTKERNEKKMKNISNRKTCLAVKLLFYSNRNVSDIWYTSLWNDYDLSIVKYSDDDSSILPIQTMTRNSEEKKRERSKENEKEKWKKENENNEEINQKEKRKERKERK